MEAGGRGRGQPDGLCAGRCDRSALAAPQLAQRRALDERRRREWTAIITGKRLKSMFDEICEGRRLSVKHSGQADAIEIVVYSA
jgi:hypothetical protein